MRMRCDEVQLFRRGVACPENAAKKSLYPCWERLQLILGRVKIPPRLTPLPSNAKIPTIASHQPYSQALYVAMIRFW
jgi:hypothetical protein